jgi:hypothetical protein
MVFMCGTSSPAVDQQLLKDGCPECAAFAQSKNDECCAPHDGDAWHMTIAQQELEIPLDDDGCRDLAD